MGAKKDPQQTIDEWLERDLSQAAEEGLLPPAFEVDDVLDQIVECVAVGRNPILTGESGVGKTAAIYELVRWFHARTVLESGGTIDLCSVGWHGRALLGRGRSS